MGAFLIFTTNDFTESFPKLSRVRFSDSINLFYNKGTFSENIYLYTGNGKTSLTSLIADTYSLTNTPPDDFFSISDDFCLIYPLVKPNIVVITDRHGKVPIFYSMSDDGFIVTTDLNSLFKNSFKLLNPSEYLIIDSSNNTLKLRAKSQLVPFSDLKDQLGYVDLLSKVGESAVLHSIKSYKKIGLFFSGGVDSSIIAQILKKNHIPFTAFVVGCSNSPDVLAAQNVAKVLDIQLETVIVNEAMIERYINEIDDIIQTKLFSSTTSTVPRVVSLEVAIVLYFGIKEASLALCDVILSAIGTEEMFIGFSLEDRHLEQNKPLVDIMRDKLTSIYTRDMYRNYRLSSHFNLDIKTPFISSVLFEIAMGIPLELKVKNQMKKYIWRQTGISLGLPAEIAMRKNKATQFGSAVSKLLTRLAKSHGYKYKRDFISDFIKEESG